MLNVRASFQRLVDVVRDLNVPLLTEPTQPEKVPCYRIQWLTAEVPRGANFFARNVLVHLVGSSSKDVSPREGIYEIELRGERLLNGLRLGHAGSIAVHPLYDYATSSSSPAQSGTFIVERSAKGIDVYPPSEADPGRRHLVLSLVLVYQR